MMRETGRGKEDVGRMRLKVKDDATKSGTNGGLGNEEKRPIPSRLVNQEADGQSSEIFLWKGPDSTTQGQMCKSREPETETSLGTSEPGWERMRHSEGLLCGFCLPNLEGRMGDSMA